MSKVQNSFYNPPPPRIYQEQGCLVCLFPNIKAEIRRHVLFNHRRLVRCFFCETFSSSVRAFAAHFPPGCLLLMRIFLQCTFFCRAFSSSVRASVPHFPPVCVLLYRIFLQCACFCRAQKKSTSGVSAVRRTQLYSCSGPSSSYSLCTYTSVLMYKNRQ